MAAILVNGFVHTAHPDQGQVPPDPSVGFLQREILIVRSVNCSISGRGHTLHWVQICIVVCGVRLVGSEV